MYDSGTTLDCPQATAETALEALFSTPQEQLDLLPVAIVIFQPDGTPVRYNRHALNLWQCPPLPDTAGVGACGDLKLFLADGTPLAPEATPVAAALQQGLATSGLALMLERPDLSRVAITLSVAPVTNACRRIVGAVACAQQAPLLTSQQALQPAPRPDLVPPADSEPVGNPAMGVDPAGPRQSEPLMHESEQRLAATYENAGIGIAETAADGHLLRVNAAFCALTGQSREALLSMHFTDLTPEDERAREHELYAQQVAGGLDHYTLEQRQIRQDGTQLWVCVVSSAVRGIDGRFLYSVRVVQDISERKLMQDHQQMLMGELNHRIKNTLATVQSLAYQTMRKTPDATSFYEKFQGRLMALSKAHSLLTRSQWSGAALHDIIEEQVLPYREGEGRRIVLTGTSVDLTSDQAVVLGMVFHELVTNAIKHGSLSHPSGRVRVNWHILPSPVDGQPWLHLLWQESGGPPAQPPQTHGFGSLFIERSIRDQLHGSTRMDFLRTGLNCRLELPLSPSMERPA